MMNYTVDKDKVINRFSRHIASYNAEASVQRDIAGELMQKVMNSEKNVYQNVLEIGCGTGFLTRELLQYFHPSAYVLNDIVEAMYFEIEDITRRHNFKDWSFISGDAEKLQFSGKFNLVVSSSTIQWFQYPKLFLEKVSGMLEDGDIFAFSTFGPDNFHEINALFGASLHYPTMETLKLWLSDSFELIHHSEKKVSLCFDTPMEVIKHIKLTGVNAVFNRQWNRHDLLNLQTNYGSQTSTSDHKVSLTYHPIFIIAKKKKPQ